MIQIKVSQGNCHYPFKSDRISITSGKPTLRAPNEKTETANDVVFSFQACLKKQFELCHQLEMLADTLPFKVDTRAAMDISEQLQRQLRRCHRKEETILFAALLAADPNSKPILDRLISEHQEDEDHANDLHDAIKAFVMDENRKGAENLGYMLRCLFVSLRRHLAFDRDFILPLYLRATQN